MGISGADYDLVEKNIMYDEYPSPVIADLRNKSSNFTRVRKSGITPEDFRKSQAQMQRET